jgi:hypothetical protein
MLLNKNVTVMHLNAVDLLVKSLEQEMIKAVLMKVRIMKMIF